MLQRFRPLYFALALIAVAGALRWPGLGKIVWNLDEGSTFTMAEVVKNGGVMYRDAADNRTPLVPYAKALILSVVGDWNIRGAHIAVALMLALTAIWLWRLGRQAKDEAAGVMAAIYFTLISFVMMGPVDAMAAHTGFFLIFFSALGLWGVVTALNRGSGALALAAGAAFALATLAKQPGLLDWGVGLVVCGLAGWNRPAQRGECAKLALMMTVGFALPLAATYWYFAAHGAWKDFLQYSWYYNTRLYVPEVPFRERLLGVRTPFVLARQNVPFAFGLAIIGAFWLVGRTLPELWRRPRQFTVLPWLILGWTASGLISTVLSGRDFAHYSIQVMPGFSLACGWVTARLWEKTSAWRTAGYSLRAWAVRGVLGLGLASLIFASIHRAAHFDLSDGISKDIGLIVKARTKPQDRMFVWGYEPELHVFSQRLPNTRFVYSVFLTGLIPWTNLDALKNTDYAIVPGAWDAFWSDFTRRPPTIIVDTHGNRGFLKYPLRDQKRLWELIEREYVEVAANYAKDRGYTIYQRATTVPANASGTAPESVTVQLTAPKRSALGTLKIAVDVPAGTTAVDLYLDDRAYRRVENLGAAAMQARFFVLESDARLGPHRLQAIARGTRDVASAGLSLLVEPVTAANSSFDGPALLFAGRKILPVESEAIEGRTVKLRPNTDQWDAHAPSKLVYPRPDGLTELAFTFGMLPGSYDGSYPQKTDGVDVSVFFEDDQGQSTSVYRRHVDPVVNEADRKVMAGRATLPGLTGGKIRFLITPGPMNSPAFDWAYWTKLEGDFPPFKLSFQGQPVPPVELEAKLGLTQVAFHDTHVMLMHAPAHFAFREQTGMTELTGKFGLLDESWKGGQSTNGAVFEVLQVLADGTIKVLFSRALYPANKPEDRGLQPLKVTLPYVPGSLIRMLTRPADATNNSFCYTFWQGLELSEFYAHLQFDGRTLNSSRYQAVNGLTYLDEAGAKVLFAHAPSEIVFNIEPGFNSLAGTLGLVHGAYTEDGNSDGAIFIVEGETAAGVRQELFRRFINPRDNPADRGALPFKVELPSLPGGRLILRTEAAPTGRLNFAWSFWGDLHVDR